MPLFLIYPICSTPEFIAEQFDGNERKLRLNMSYIDEREMLSQSNPMNGGSCIWNKGLSQYIWNDIETAEQVVVKRRQSSITFKPDGMLSVKKIAEGYVENVKPSIC